jgi:hypothetical protein
LCPDGDAFDEKNKSMKPQMTQFISSTTKRRMHTGFHRLIIPLSLSYTLSWVNKKNTGHLFSWIYLKCQCRVLHHHRNISRFYQENFWHTRWKKLICFFKNSLRLRICLTRANTMWKRRSNKKSSNIGILTSQ